MCTVSKYVENDTGKTTEDYLHAIADVIHNHEVDQILDSRQASIGLGLLHFVAGDEGLRWFFTNHTYCFQEVLKELGKFFVNVRSRGLLDLRQKRHAAIDASVAATVVTFVINEYAYEFYNRVEKKTLVYQTNLVLKGLRLDSENAKITRREMRYFIDTHFSEDGLFRSANTFQLILKQNTGSSTQVVRLVR